MRQALKRLAATAAVCGSIVAATGAGTALAGTPAVFQFHDCVGPPGTPPSFTAEKIELPPPAGPSFAQATGYRLTDGSGVFIALIRDDIHHPPGVDGSGAATISCLVDTPLKGTLTYRGFLAPPT